jgi:hypothetical protein
MHLARCEGYFGKTTARTLCLPALTFGKDVALAFTDVPAGCSMTLAIGSGKEFVNHHPGKHSSGEIESDNKSQKFINPLHSIAHHKHMAPNPRPSDSPDIFPQSNSSSGVKSISA